MNARDEFLAAVSDLTLTQLLAISAEHRAQRGPGLDEARAKAGQLADELGRRDEIDRIIGQIAQWAGAAASASASYAWSPPTRDQLLADAQTQAVPAIIDAALAVMLADHLDASAADVLSSGWRASDIGRR